MRIANERKMQMMMENILKERERKRGKPFFFLSHLRSPLTSTILKFALRRLNVKKKRGKTFRHHFSEKKNFLLLNKELLYFYSHLFSVHIKNAYIRKCGREEKKKWRNENFDGGSNKKVFHISFSLHIKISAGWLSSTGASLWLITWNFYVLELPTSDVI